MPEESAILMRDFLTGLHISYRRRRDDRGERGSAYVLALVAMITGLTLALTLLRASSGHYLSESSRDDKDAARYMAEAGIDYASWQVGDNNVQIPYTADVTLDSGSFHVAVEDDGQLESGTVLVTSVGTAGTTTYTAKRVIAGQIDIIMDNPDGYGYPPANWLLGTSSRDKYGPSYIWTPTKLVTNELFVWTPNIIAPGQYEVFAWWCQGSNRSTVTPFIIDHANGSTTVTMNQQINGGRWNSLGVFEFVAGTSGTIKVSRYAPTGKVVVADAIRLIKM